MAIRANPLYQPQALSIYLLTFVIALVAALILPSFSLFLESELKVRPFLVGLPFAGMAFASIGFNYWIGGWSDKIRDRRPLIAGCCLLGLVSCLVFAFIRDYWLIFAIAISIFSLSMVAFSQILAYSLDYAHKSISTEKVPLFNSIVRAQIALAWVGGPPLGFFLATRYGFSTTYLITAAAYLLLMLLVFYFLEALSAESPTEKNQPIPLRQNPNFHALIFAVIGFSLLFGVNNAYLISLPLHLKNELQIGAEWMGPMMGLAAGLEIPFMLLAGYWAARVSMLQLIMLAAISALLLYTGVYFSTQLWQFFALQIFNAIFIGVLVGLGVSVIQQLLPGQSGVASSLYTNTTHIGNLFSSLIVSLVADYFDYHAVFLVNLVLVLMAVWAFSRLKNLTRS